MTFDDKVDLVLKKLNGSEGAELHTDIQTWLTPEHSNPVDNQLIMDLLTQKRLVKLKGSRSEYIFIITAKGRRINDKNGWKKYLWRKRRDEIVKDIITYSNIVFAVINIGILIYSLNQNKSIDNEVTNLRIELEKQHIIRNENGVKLDSLQQVIVKQGQAITKMDSTVRVTRQLTKKK